MQSEETQRIVILDPGLREFGGHHPAIIEGLNGSSAVIQDKLDITLFCNTQSSNTLRLHLSKSGIQVIPHFNTDFYRHFYSEEKLSTFNEYIQVLAKEYFQAMSEFDAIQVTFLYHTLNWEHAVALSLAISLYKKRKGEKHRHLVCLMYSPCMFNDKQRLNRNRYFKFNFAFKVLAKHNNVSLFSAEYELTQHYKKMLECHISWHPCGLLSSDHLEDIKKNVKSTEQILLYLGDAKSNKGFLQLPELLSTLSKAISDPNCHFVIQYTITNDNQELLLIAQALDELQKSDPRILIYRHFLSDNEMHQLWLNTKYVIFNYQESAYKYQSSGVLWLAVAYQVSIFLTTKTWLNREAKRLNAYFFESEGIDETKSQLCRHIESSKRERVAEAVGKNPNTSTNYSEKLFSDFGMWIIKQLMD